MVVAPAAVSCEDDSGSLDNAGLTALAMVGTAASAPLETAPESPETACTDPAVAEEVEAEDDDGDGALKSLGFLLGLQSTGLLWAEVRAVSTFGISEDDVVCGTVSRPASMGAT